MASIIVDLSDDIKKLQSLKKEIQEVKKELGSINVNVRLDIKRDMEAKLKSLTTQYDALVQKVSQAEGKIIASTQRINQAAEKIVNAQEQLAKATGTQQTGNATGNNTAANQAETASVQAQAKAYDELADEIDAVMGTRSQNIRRMVEEQNAIRLINAEISKLNKYQGNNSTLSASQQRRLEQLNASLLQHKTALSELRQSLNNSFKLDNSAATSMNALSQSLGRMRMAYRELTEEERKSPFGQELLASIQQADAKIKQLDASIGNHQRNVGNYASGWNGLSMSIQQIGRELPSLAVGWSTFFLAISNNLPILSDELARARKEYNELKAAGKQATPVWKQVVSSLLSWQTALTVGITLLTLYGKDLANWVSGLFGADEAHKRLNESIKEFNTLVGESQAKAKILMDTIKQSGEGTKGRADAIRQFNSEYGKYLKNMLSENSSLMEIEQAYRKVNKALMENAALKARQSAIDKVLEDALEKQSVALMKIQDGVGARNVRPVTETVMNWTEEYRQAGASWQNAFNDIVDNVRKRVGKLPEDFYTALEDYVRSVYESGREIDNIQAKYNPFFNKKKADEAMVQNRAYWENQRTMLVEQLNALSDLEAKGEKGIKIKLSIQDIDNKLKSFDFSSQAKTYNGINSQQGKIDDMLRKQAQARISQQIDLENQVAQARIDAMADGAEKERSQRELDNKMELQDIEQQKRDYIQSVIQSQKEIFDAQEELKAKQDTSYKKKTFDASSVKVDTSSYDELLALTQSRQVSDQWDKEEQAWNKYLQEYGTYQEKRLAITQEYQQKIAEATTEGDRMTLQKQMEEALSNLDIEALKTTSAISQLFGDMTDKTLAELERINKEGSAALEFLKGGQWDEGKGVSFGITKEQFDTISKTPEKLQAISKALRENKEAAEELRPAYEKVADGLRKIFNAGGDSKKINEALEDIQEGLGQIMQAGSFLSDTFSSLGDAFGSKSLSGVSEGINTAMDALSAGMQGAQAGSLFGPIGAAAGAAIGVVTSLASSIAKIHDKKNEKRIQALQDQIDTLTSTYDKLGRAVEDAYSKDASGLIEDQNKLLEQQKVLIQQQIREEEEKKKTDEERIKQWKEQLEEINQTIEDNKEAAVDAIFGEDVQSAIENFVDAYADAWTNGENRATAAKDTVKNMMKQMVTESIKAAIQSSGKMEQIRQKLQEFYADNVLTGWEQDYIYNMAEQLQNELDKQFGWADSLFKDEDTAKQQQSSRGYGITASQDSVDEMNGRLTAMAESNYRIEDATQQQTLAITDIKGSIAGLTAQVQANYNVGDEVRTILAQSYIELQGINENTGAIVKPIQQMQKDIEEVKRNTSRL